MGDAAERHASQCDRDPGIVIVEAFYGIAVLFALGVMCVVRCVERPLQGLRERVPLSLYPLVEVALGIGLAWAVHFDLWSLWHIPMRADSVNP